MSPTEKLTSPEAARRNTVQFRGRAFGLDVSADFVVPGLGEPAGASTARKVVIERVRADELDRAFRIRQAATLLERRDPAERLVMRVDVHEDDGYRIFAPRFGRHVVSHDGRRIRSALPRGAPWRWQRLLFAQALPLSATLQGLDLFHASAVSVDGRGIAFIAPSGTGKTSVAVHLSDQRAELITDDVLALERAPTHALAHRGGGLFSVPPHEFEALSELGRRRIGEVAGWSDKVLVTPRREHTVAPLDAVYILERSRDAVSISIARCDPPETQLLLASSFITYLSTQAVLMNHLETCGLVARTARMFVVTIPQDADARNVATAIRQSFSGDTK